MSYYYLVASLPTLTLGDPPPIASEAFRFSTTGVLSPEDRAELDAILDGEPGRGKAVFTQAWYGVDAQVRNAAARIRGPKLGAEARNDLRDHPGFLAWVEKAVTDAFGKPTPLERELALDRCRWEALDDLARGEPFGLGAVLAFAAKLRLVERWAAMDEAVGLQNVNEIIDGMEQNAEGAER